MELMFLDFTKAFDSLEWDFLFKCLKKFNLEENFITNVFAVKGPQCMWKVPLCFKIPGDVFPFLGISRAFQQLLLVFIMQLRLGKLLVQLG
jgi:hypothetical protein